jgi:hypothetical protein|tara:strand:- start:689 stop:1063 length:375 start_codon:yes stop_codon:yes gene_type:complete
MKTKPYRNKFEAHAAEVLGDLCTYESKKVPYVTNRNYIPDFIGPHKNIEDREILVEAKGYFRVGDIQKYKAIRDCLSDAQELVFLLYNPTKRVRKGGKLNMKQWCEKEGFRNYTLGDIIDAFTT